VVGWATVPLPLGAAETKVIDVTALAHPEVMPDGTIAHVEAGIVDKLHYGDPTKGWEGDPNLQMAWNGQTEVWTLWRLEDDCEWRVVCRSKPGVPFDERLIEQLVSWDRRRFKKSLHDQIVEKNAAVEREIQRANDEYINEEVNPRLDWALKKDGLL
jgi:hypothetical protein